MSLPVAAPRFAGVRSHCPPPFCSSAPDLDQQLQSPFSECGRVVRPFTNILINRIKPVVGLVGV